METELRKASRGFGVFDGEDPGIVVQGEDNGFASHEWGFDSPRFHEVKHDT